MAGGREDRKENRGDLDVCHYPLYLAKKVSCQMRQAVPSFSPLSFFYFILFYIIFSNRPEVATRFERISILIEPVLIVFGGVGMRGKGQGLFISGSGARDFMVPTDDVAVPEYKEHNVMGSGSGA